jgi:hypothetical protein
MKTLLLLIAAPLLAQTAIPTATKSYCPGAIPSIAVVAMVPMPVGSGFVPMPVCIQVGAGFTIDQSRVPWQLNASAVAAPQQQQFTETFTLDPATPPATTTATFTLKRAPVANTVFFAVFKSSQYYGDTVQIVAAGATNQLVVALPTYRPFAAGDTLTVVYWALP